MPGQMTEKLRFHRKKHDGEAAVVASESTMVDGTLAEPGQVGVAEDGVVAHHEEEEVPQMNIITTVVRLPFDKLDTR